MRTDPRTLSVSAIILSFILVVILNPGCAGVTHQPYYEGGSTVSAAEMIPVKDKDKKFDFMIPPGWKEISYRQPLPENLELPRHHPTEYGGTSTYQKGDKGSMFLFCRIYGNTDYNIEKSLYELSPSSVMVEGPLQLKSTGWDPEFRRYDSSIVEKGEKAGFSFFFGTKMQGTFSLFNCDYVVLARSATLEDSEEIRQDFIAVMKSLRN